MEIKITEAQDARYLQAMKAAYAKTNTYAQTENASAALVILREDILAACKRNMLPPAMQNAIASVLNGDEAFIYDALCALYRFGNSSQNGKSAKGTSAEKQAESVAKAKPTAQQTSMWLSMNYILDETTGWPKTDANGNPMIKA